jgi:hypothetical protein
MNGVGRDDSIVATVTRRMDGVRYRALKGPATFTRPLRGTEPPNFLTSVLGEIRRAAFTGTLGGAAAILLLACLTSGGCARQSGHPTEAANTVAGDIAGNEVRGWLDRVEGKPRIGSNVNLVGWAATERPESRIEKIEILLDGMEIAETVAGVERSDVADSYGKPSWSRSGWETEVLLDKILPGEHEIEAVALDSRGAKHALRGARFITVLDSR